ncbi:type II secretion system protein GspG [Verrucomicrobiota bacterium]
MSDLNTNAKKYIEGFTLLEVVIVVSILGLLAALGLLGVRNAQTKVSVERAQAELEVIASAVLELAWDTGHYPNQKPRNINSSVERWDVSENAAGLLGSDGNFPNWDGPYLDEVPLDPWGNKYFFDPDYKVDGVMRAVVGSFGPNGVGRNQYDADDVYVIIK